jgi:hypothetical protein
MNSANGRGGIRTHTRVTPQGILSPLPDSASANPVRSCDATLSNYSTGRSTGNELDADLERVLDAWPTLPDALKAGILATIVAAARKG